MEALAIAAPDIVVLMPCGFSASRTVAEAAAVCRTDDALSKLLASARKAFAVDAGSYFSRPGPRLVDGLELMAEICGGGASIRCPETVIDVQANFRLTGIFP
jgi:iron complex transport system substrate-binding protein